MVAGTVELVLFAMSFSALRESWNEEDVIAVASAEAAEIRLSTANGG